MVLRGATSLLVALEGVGPENLYFFGPKWHERKVPRHKNNRYINSYYPMVKYGVRSPKYNWAQCAQLYSLDETP